VLSLVILVSAVLVLLRGQTESYTHRISDAADCCTHATAVGVSNYTLPRSRFNSYKNGAFQSV